LLSPTWLKLAALTAATIAKSVLIGDEAVEWLGLDDSLVGLGTFSLPAQHVEVQGHLAGLLLGACSSHGSGISVESQLEVSSSEGSIRGAEVSFNGEGAFVDLRDFLGAQTVDGKNVSLEQVFVERSLRISGHEVIVKFAASHSDLLGNKPEDLLLSDLVSGWR